MMIRAVILVMMTKMYLGVKGDVSPADSDVVDEIQEMVTHIIVNYEGSFFPGLITRVKKKGQGDNRPTCYIAHV